MRCARWSNLEACSHVEALRRDDGARAASESYDGGGKDAAREHLSTPVASLSGGRCCQCMCGRDQK